MERNVKQVPKIWASGQFDPDGQLVARELNLFEPGLRVQTYIAQEVQTMDIYYGQIDTLYQKRDPVIAEFVHYAMGYKESFQDAVNFAELCLVQVHHPRLAIKRRSQG